MKLRFLKLHNKYKSLEPMQEGFKFLKHPLLKGHIDPICLVGLNGSGKSNLLELLADIFFDIEKFFLQENKFYTEGSTSYFAYADNKEPILFELEYKIGVNDTDIKISRTKETEGKIKFYRKQEVITKGDLFKPSEPIKDFVEIPIETVETYKEIREKYIPLVVAYTSGLNDLLTLPFVDLQDFYAQQVAREALNGKEAKQAIPSPNLLLLNYESNASIVVSNFLFAQEGSNKQKVFSESLRIERLNSFRIIVRLNKLYGNKKVKITNELQGYIENLKNCSSLSNIKIDTKKGNEYIFDFIVNSATKELFLEKFTTAQKLFEALTKLNLLNTLCIQSKYRDLLRNKREKGQLLKFPQVASLDKIFSIEKIELVLTKPVVRTEYEKISDGEHQFIHIIGGIVLFDDKNPKKDILYLLDEPDTHFNPLWRSDFFYQLENVLDNKNVEFVVTTHSPFILADAHAYNVFKFTRNGENVSFKRLEKETYGATIQNVTEAVFELEETDENYKNNKHFNHKMAKLAYNDIQKLYDEIDKITTLDEWLNNDADFQKRIRMLGESMDRLYVIKRYTEKEQELRNP